MIIYLKNVRRDLSQNAVSSAYFWQNLIYLGYKATIIVLSCLHCNEYALLFCWFTLTDLSVRILYFDFMSKGDLYFDINVKSCDVF